MSTKKKHLFIFGIVVANLFLIFIIKNWGNIYETWFNSKPYYLPTQTEIEKEAYAIAASLNDGDVDYILSKFDLNAIGYFDKGVTNWVNEAKQHEANTKLKEDLTGVKECACTDIYRSDDTNIVRFALTFEDGEKREAISTFYKDKRGKIGVTLFAVQKPTSPKS